MTLDDIKALRASGDFHHATYRNQGSIWEGLYIYRKSNLGRGFDVAGVFHKDSPDLNAAHDLVRDTGVSVGAYGQG